MTETSGSRVPDVRAAAARVIAAVAAHGQSLDRALPPEAGAVAARDRPLLHELCYGTLRWHPRFAALIARLVAKPLKERDAVLHALIASALYQLEHTRVPPHAAIHAAVAACAELERPWAKGLVNAVLRRFQREREQLDRALAGDIGYRTAHPAWLAEALLRDWPEQAEAVMRADNDRAPMTLRVNRTRGTREAYLERLAAAGVAAAPTAHAPDGIRLAAPRGVEELPGFEAGLVSVQDEAAQLCAPLLGPRPGQRVLDACCAPGGKTGHLLELEPGIGELIALDNDAVRLRKVADNLARLGLRAQLLAADAGTPADWWDGVSFDRILLDAPCSATGVLRRHPDIKLLRRPDDIPALAASQAHLLAALWELLAPGGLLLYATCSVLRAENDAVVTAFAAQRSDVVIRPLPDHPGLATDAGRQWLPDADHDGFYYALLERR